MRLIRHSSRRAFLTLLPLLLAGCAGADGDGSTPGIDVESRVLRIGILNDLSGPAATIGRPMQTGLEMLYRQVNAGVGLLPQGWTVEWVTRDHGYNPQQSVQMYNEISEDVLYLGLSMGSSMTLPLHPMLDRDGMVAIPASLSSRTARNEPTPVSGMRSSSFEKSFLFWLYTTLRLATVPLSPVQLRLPVSRGNSPTN